MEESSCYGGKASLDLIADSWRTSGSDVTHKLKSMALLEDFQQWVSVMPFSERVLWAVGGMVLTAGLLFVRSDAFLLPLHVLKTHNVLFLTNLRFADIFNRADFPISILLHFLFCSLL